SQTGPTALITYRAGRLPAPVAFASPVGQPPRRRHSSMIDGPPARWMAPSTPPPPRSPLFAAFTIASTATVVMSPWTSSRRTSIAFTIASGGKGARMDLRAKQEPLKAGYRANPDSGRITIVARGGQGDE